MSLGNITPEYEAGGFSTNNGDEMGQSLPEVIGRLRNNLNGTTAANMFNAREAEKSRIFNANEAQKQRDHELYMSNTAYQRAAADMRAAGINPATLSGLSSSGGGASSSSSSAASSSAASSANGKSSNIVGTLIKAAVGLALMA